MCMCIYVYGYTYMHAITTGEERDHESEGDQGKWIEGFGGKKWKGEILKL